ncbi:Voltage-dependent L-type calcium channel subunit alpha-1F (Voltage-gated calcium channel subunit alpha Cav1.4) [Durusdinium trenchii]|uniref:Voltage-dependent L-type calcium channel subunit alpha-1F (Voltage-gated calcium channel subunit alpha Cav1.4) n=1 Tax=Durusdinium trenchii TaxID=1381693 RepID=A0ABP0R9R7_9DINO
MPDLEESPSSQLCWEETPEEKPDPPERTERRSVEGRRVMFQSKTVDLRHSLLHQIAELETQSRAPLNRKKSVTRILTTALAPPLHRQSTWASEEMPQTRLAEVQLYFQQRVVETTAFESVVIFMICLNTVMIGVNCDWNLTHLNLAEPEYFQIVERFFAGVFALELLLRIFAYGRRFFFGRSDWQWNWFDLIIVSFQIVEEVSTIVKSNDGEIHLSSSTTAIRIIRMFRLLRILRIVRLLRFIQDLRSMLLSILSTLRALGWTMVLLVMIIYAAAVFFAQFIIDAGAANVDIMVDKPELQYYYSDLLRTMLSLYQSMTGGLSWDVALRPLEEAAGGWLAVPYALYVAFVVLALTNIATGMFVQASLGAHEKQREKEIRKQLRHLFRTADLNHDGTLTWDEFERFLDNEEQSRYFLNVLCMDAREAKGLFLLLDTREVGQVSFEELLDGVLRLKGTAQAIDLATLMYCNKRMITWLRERLNGLQDSLDALASDDERDHAPAGRSLHPRPRVRKVSVYASWNEVKTRDGLQRQTVVLVGVTGDGKSSTGNTLCGSSAFPVSAGFKSETQELAHADYLRGATFWRVIDTIGLHDTHLSQKEVLERFSTFSEAAAEGIDVFLFVLRWGRFKPEHDEALAAFAVNCGETALRHTMLVFTHCDLDDEALSRQLLDPSAPPALTHWLQRIGGGAVGIDNLDGSTARPRVQRALEGMVAGLAGLRYSNEALEEARAKLKAAEEAESRAFAAAVAEWRRSSGPVVIEREAGVITRPPVKGEADPTAVSGADATGQ